MYSIKRWLGAAAFLVMMIALFSGQAQAQRQGGGNNAAGTTLVFDYVATVNGKTPTWSGDFTMGAPAQVFYSMITNLSFSIRGKNLNLPDNTLLYIDIYTSDVATGAQTDTSTIHYHCMASPMQVVSKLGIVKGYNNFIDPLDSTIVRKLDKVVISDGNGNVLATAHP